MKDNNKEKTPKPPQGKKLKPPDANPNEILTFQKRIETSNENQKGEKEENTK
jgi:hypothetical protein